MLNSVRPAAPGFSPTPRVSEPAAELSPHRGINPAAWFTRVTPRLSPQMQRSGRAVGAVGVGWSLAAVCAPAATASFAAAPIAYQFVLGASAAAAAYLACATLRSAAWTLLGVSTGILYAAAAIPAATLTHILGSAALGGFAAYHIGAHVNTIAHALWVLAAVGVAALTLYTAQHRPTPHA